MTKLKTAVKLRIEDFKYGFQPLSVFWVRVAPVSFRDSVSNETIRQMAALPIKLEELL